MTIKFNPSSAVRWWTCSGSARLEAQFGEKVFGYAAQQGVVAHKLAEICLKDNVDPLTKLGTRIVDEIKVKVDREMAESVQKYMEYVWSLRLEYSRLYLERNLSHSLKNGVTISGICDALITERDEQIHLIDFKYGKHKVAATRNQQLYMYALMVKNQFKTDIDITIHVCQPRIDHYPKIALSPEILDSFERELQIKIHSCFNPNPEFVVGDHCKFCSAKSHCEAYRKNRRKSFWSFK